MLTPSSRRSASAVDRSWSEPHGIAVVGRPVPATPPDVEDLEIEPGMIVGVGKLHAAPAVPPPVPAVPAMPAAPHAPHFFHLPLARPGSSLPPPPPLAHPPAGTASFTAPPVPARRPTTTKSHDATWRVSPLPPPAASGPYEAVPHPDAPRPRVPRNWITIGTSAVATGVALAIVMALVSPRAPEIAPAPDSVAAAALPGPPAATEPPRTAVLAPGKKAAAKPLALPRPRIATNLGAKAAMPATKSPVTRARTAAPATKQAAKQPVAAKPRPGPVDAG